MYQTECMNHFDGCRREVNGIRYRSDEGVGFYTKIGTNTLTASEERMAHRRRELDRFTIRWNQRVEQGFYLGSGVG